MKICRCTARAGLLIFFCCHFFAGMSALPVRAENLAPASVEPTLLREVIRSVALKRDMPATIYLPPGYQPSRRYPVLYLYHGMRTNEGFWDVIDVYGEATKLIEAGRIDPLIIVAPLLNNSFGVNNRASFSHVNPADQLPVTYDGGRYEDYLRKDVIQYVDKRFSTIRDRSGRYVGGISMGGFAALHLAFKYPKLFSRVGGHSPALVRAEWDWLYPRNRLPEESRDPLVMARHRNLAGLEVYLDCGLQDEFDFQAPMQQLSETLKKRGVELQSHLRDGAHTLNYWSAHLPEYLAFYAAPRNAAGLLPDHRLNAR